MDSFPKIRGARRSPEINQLSTALAGFALTESITLPNGDSFTFRTLEADELSWAAQFVDTTNALALDRTQRAPHLAASLIVYNGKPVESHFEVPKDLNELEKAYFEDTKRLKFWRFEQVREWLGEQGEEFQRALWPAYQKLQERRKKVVAAVGPLSSPILPGEPSPTS